MTKPTLLVCTSCSASIDHEDVTDVTVTEGVQLFNQLQESQQDKPENSPLNIQKVGCLWTCDRPCSVTFACPGKYTYHFVDLFVDLNDAQSVAELQQFSALYLNSPDGYVKPPKMPGELRSRLLVRIPPIS
jgi:predicted metal-binding protein